MSNPILITSIFSFAISIYLIYYIKFHPLAHIPGPFISKFSNIPWLLRFLSGYEYKHDVQLFKKYGPLVRVGPNTLAFSDPSFLSAVYNRDAWKGENYNVSEGYGIFGIKSSRVHAERKKMLNHPFNTESVKGYRTIIQKNVDFWLDALDQTHATRKNEPSRFFDFVQWPSFFSYDTLTELAFGEPMGFIREQADLNGMYAEFEAALYPLGAIIRMPSILTFLKSTGLWDMMKAKPTDTRGAGVVMAFADRMIQKRISNPSDKRDILNQYLLSKPLRENRAMLFSELLLLIVAGTDTVAIAIRSILTQILENPGINAHLLSLTPGSPEYKIYITAIIKESLRLMPPSQMPFSRISSPQGYHLGNYYVPGNIEIYPSFYTLNRSTRIWGSDANEFRPERWLAYLAGTEKWDIERTKVMDVTFGWGSRMCLGKAVAEMELQLVFEGLWERFEIRDGGLERSKEVKVFNQMRFGEMRVAFRKRERGEWVVDDMEEI